MKEIFAQIHDEDKVPSYMIITSCSINECPLLKCSCCIERSWFGRCLYSSRRRVDGVSKRSKLYGQKKKEMEDKNKELISQNGLIQYPKTRMYVVGDYVYLPYSHMDMNKSVKFEEHSNVFHSGLSFVKIEDFNEDAVKSIIQFRPMSLIGGEITSYQQESVPLFIYHLYKYFPDMYDRFYNVLPTIDDVIARISKIVDNRIKDNKVPTIFIGNVPKGVVSGYSVGPYKNIDSWDGEKLIMSGEIKSFLESMYGHSKIEFTPEPNTQVKVSSTELLKKIIIDNPELLS